MEALALGYCFGFLIDGLVLLDLFKGAVSRIEEPGS
jgi:hypothetical protein